jgi:hypothetical protein
MIEVWKIKQFYAILYNKSKYTNWVWYFTSIIPALGRLRQKDGEF